MMRIEWNDEKFGLGIEEIDNQHKNLVEIINTLSDSVDAGESDKVLRKTFNALLEYSKEHFSTEEKYMLRFGFEGYEKHLEEHRYFSVRVFEFEEKLAMESAFLDKEILLFLGGWLIHHVSHIDRKYIDCFKKNGL